nr:MAG TPA: U3 small nucleolar ribonucleoprotein [Caudoviricetes sp.]
MHGHVGDFQRVCYLLDAKSSFMTSASKTHLFTSKY